MHRFGRQKHPDGIFNDVNSLPYGIRLLKSSLYCWFPNLKQIYGVMTFIHLQNGFYVKLNKKLDFEFVPTVMSVSGFSLIYLLTSIRVAKCGVQLKGAKTIL